MPNLVSVFGIFMLTQFFRTLPIELEEAARIDGASRLAILLRIVRAAVAAGARDARGDPVPVDVERLPLAARDDLTNQDAFTLQLGLATFQGAHQTDTGTWSRPANIMSMLPMLVLFLVAQRSFVRGIATQGLKG